MTSQAEDRDSRAEDTGAQSSGSSQARQEAGNELIDELTRLGQKFVEVVDVAWNSEQRKQVEEDLRNGLVSIANTLEEGFKRVSSSKEAKEAVSAAEDVAEKVRTSKIGVELSEALAQGLRSLSEQMDKLSQEMRQRSEAAAKRDATGKESQDIPISRDPDSRGDA